MAARPLAPCPVCAGEPQPFRDLFGEVLERGGRHGVPTRDAIRLLMRREEIGLIAALNG